MRPRKLHTRPERPEKRAPLCAELLFALVQKRAKSDATRRNASARRNPSIRPCFAPRLVFGRPRPFPRCSKPRIPPGFGRPCPHRGKTKNSTPDRPLSPPAPPTPTPPRPPHPLAARLFFLLSSSAPAPLLHARSAHACVAATTRPCASGRAPRSAATRPRPRAAMLVDSFVVDSPNVRYDDEHITAVYECARRDVTPRLSFFSSRLAPARPPRPPRSPAPRCTPALLCAPASPPASSAPLTQDAPSLQLCEHHGGAARRGLGGLARHHTLRVSHQAQGAQIRVRRCARSRRQAAVSHVVTPSFSTA